MFAAKASRLVSQAQRGALQCRNMSVLSGPPTVKVSPAEKLAHGVFMTVSMLVVPCWVLLNIRKYRGEA